MDIIQDDLILWMEPKTITNKKQIPMTRHCMNKRDETSLIELFVPL